MAFEGIKSFLGIDEKSKPKRTSNDGLMPFNYGVGYMGSDYHNPATGQGTPQDPNYHGRFTWRYIPEWELYAMYEENGLAAKMIDLPVDDMLKNWREFDGAKAEAIKAEEKRTGYQVHVKDWVKEADVLGGAVMIPLIYGQDDLEVPLDKKAIRKGDLFKWLVLGKLDIKKHVTNYTDPTSDNYLKPDYYILPTLDGTINVHPSRVFELSGIKRTVGRRITGVCDLWGISRLARYYDSIKSYESAIGATVQTINDGNIDVLSEEGLGNALTTEEETNILRRASLIASLKSRFRILLQDKEAEFSRNSSNFSGLAPTLEIAQEDCSMVSGIPATKLFGKAKAGMSGDTNDGDIRNYNSDLETRQKDFEHELMGPDEIIIRSATGNYAIPDYTWNPISVVTGSEAAKIERDLAEAAAKRIESGQIAPEETRKPLQAGSHYKLDDAAFNAHQAKQQKDNQDGKKDDQL